MDYREIKAHFKIKQERGDISKAICPCHPDKQASLSIKYDNKQGKTVIYCHAGCETRDILSSVGLKIFDLFDRQFDKDNSKSNIEAVYKYTDEKGVLLFEKVRFKPKRFSQRRIINGMTVWGLEKGTYYETFPGSNAYSKNKKEGAIEREFDGVQPVIYNLPKVIEAVKNSEPVFILEGEKDCINLEKWDFTTTCNFDGASKSNQKSKWKKSYNRFFKDADVIVIPDNDDSGRAHMNSIAENIILSAKSVKIVNLPDMPEKGDISDYIAAGHTKEELEDLIKKTENYKNMTDKCIEKPPYCDENGNVDNWNLVQYILERQPSYTKGNLWYLYNDEHGFYDYMELKEVQRMFFQYAIKNKDKTVLKSKKFAELLMLNSEDARDIHDEKRYINCLNGIIDIENDELLPHDSKYKLEIQFQANYISDKWEEKFNDSEFKNFLESTLDQESIITLQESWGLMLSPHGKEVQQCFIYKGEGSNGKSAAFDIQEALINDNRYICSIGLGDFGETFVISVAEGKHVNIVRDDELSGKTVHKSFKSMCCGEPVLVNRKNKDLCRLGFNMTMFFGLNRMPSAADKSTGFFRRPIIIPFNVSFGTEKEVSKGIRDKVKDTQLADRIIANELDIVFMWAYEGLKRVKDNKWKVTMSKAAEQEMEEYREEVDSAYAFFKEKIILVSNKGEKITVGDVYTSYNKWCESKNIAPMNPTHFGRQLSSFGIKRKKSNGNRYYLNIEIKNYKEVETGNYPFSQIY